MHLYVHINKYKQENKQKTAMKLSYAIVLPISHLQAQWLVTSPIKSRIII